MDAILDVARALRRLGADRAAEQALAHADELEEEPEDEFVAGVAADMLHSFALASFGRVREAVGYRADDIAALPPDQLFRVAAALVGHEALICTPIWDW